MNVLKLRIRKLLLFLIYLDITMCNFAFSDNITVVNQTNNPKIVLSDQWKVKSNNSESEIIVSVPYFNENKETNSLECIQIFSIPDTISYFKVRIWILGLHGYSFIYLNNSLIKEHPNIASTFYIDIDKEKIKEKNNELKIKLEQFDNSGKSHDLRYPNYLKQYRPLGIAREVYLEFFPNNYLDNLKISYSEKSINLNYKLNINDTIKSAIPKTIKVDEQILSPNDISIYKRFEYFEHKKSFKNIQRQINIRYPEEWSYESPNLYTLILSIKSTDGKHFKYEKKFGLRDVKAINDKILLNNKPLQIKGINYRYNFANNLNYIKQSKSDLQLIKDIGLNAVRLINYPPHHSIAHFADSIGIYLFIDNGIWRLPNSYYSNNKYFNIGKSVISEISDQFRMNPSVVGIGIGNEPNIKNANEKKFTIVLKKYLSDNFNFLVYISPLEYSLNSHNKCCDILLMQNYSNPEKPFALNQKQQQLNLPIILGNMNYPCLIFSDENQLNDVRRFFVKYDSLNAFSGYFLESFNDWYGDTPNLYTKIESNNKFIYQSGIVDLERNLKPTYNQIRNYLNKGTLDNTHFTESKKSNFQSLIVFIVALIFFIIYKQNYRLRENLKRSIQHPYGFFVDLRDRRIISIFNSTLMGLTIGTIISSFLSSIIYVNHTSILVDEYVNILILKPEQKLIYLSIIQSPWKLFFIIFISFTLLQFIFAIVIKIVTIFIKEKRKLRQIFSVISWSGAPLLFFIPFAIFGNNLVASNIFFPEIFWFFLLFLIWYNFRFANGLRVLYLIQPLKMFVFVFLTYFVLIISFLVYLNVNLNVFEYLKMLSAAQNLY